METIKGKALIFWADSEKRSKRDSIDTDQITPSSYCVSESLDDLDRQWKEGTFRYLMPDFKDRLQSGENFLVVGNRFGIGSSREMSPLGIQALGKEVNQKVVILCGQNPGQIFLRNAIQAGLIVIENPEAVQDAQDSNEFELDQNQEILKNLTRQKTYKAPLNQGGLFGRNISRAFQPLPDVHWPDPELALQMTLTEQILWAHRMQSTDQIQSGSLLRFQGDLFPASDGTAPLAIYTFNRLKTEMSSPLRVAIIHDHFVFNKREADRKQTQISKDFAEQYSIKFPYFSQPGDGIFHFFLPQNGLIQPGGFYAGADSHSRAYGAYGALGIGIGSTALGIAWATGEVEFKVPQQRRVRFTGKLQKWVTGKDIILSLLLKWGTQQAQKMSVELIDTQQQLSMAYRNTIANMMAEAEAANAIFPFDEITRRWFQERGLALHSPQLTPGENAVYALDEDLDLSKIGALVAKPFSPSNSYPIEEVEKEKISIQKAIIGSCTNGSYEDLLQAAQVIYLGTKKGFSQKAPLIKFLIYPGSRLVKQEIEIPDSRLEGHSIAQIFRDSGAEIRESWCGPCFGQGEDALTPGEKAITTFNRNWQNRMGVQGEGYLASPLIVASSALAGMICSPEALGMKWEELNHEK